jgi:hypothetical protein
MRQPGTLLPTVDAEALQPLLDVSGEPSRTPSLVLEDEHPDTSRLAVANRRKTQLRRPRRGLAKCGDNGFEFAARAMAEEGKRDVQVPTRERTNAP